MKIKFLSLCILAGVLFANRVNASENNSKDDVKYAALTQKDFDALPVEKELRFWMNWGLSMNTALMYR